MAFVTSVPRDCRAAKYSSRSTIAATAPFVMCEYASMWGVLLFSSSNFVQMMAGGPSSRVHRGRALTVHLHISITMRSSIYERLFSILWTFGIIVQSLLRFGIVL
jgi:hypothetical protein